MAYREIAMWEILEVLRRLGRGEKQRAVARVTGHGRMTVRSYEEAARELGWTVWVIKIHSAPSIAGIWWSRRLSPYITMVVSRVRRGSSERASHCRLRAGE